jgi:hypothetical protein
MSPFGLIPLLICLIEKSLRALSFESFDSLSGRLKGRLKGRELAREIEAFIETFNHH